MALIRCPECRKKVSDQAPACPQCGAPLDAIALMSAEKRLGPIYEELLRLHATSDLSDTGASVLIQKKRFGNVSLHRDPSSKDHKEVLIDGAGALKVLRKLPDGSGEQAIWDAFRQQRKSRRVGYVVVILAIILLPVAVVFVSMICLIRLDMPYNSIGAPRAPGKDA